jgi:hypothetical protein
VTKQISHKYRELLAVKLSGQAFSFPKNPRKFDTDITKFVQMPPEKPEIDKSRFHCGTYLKMLRLLR